MLELIEPQADVAVAEQLTMDQVTLWLYGSPVSEVESVSVFSIRSGAGGVKAMGLKMMLEDRVSVEVSEAVGSETEVAVTCTELGGLILLGAV